MKVNVTQEHINRGREKDSLKCPIALAISEQYELPPHGKLHVGRFEIATVSYFKRRKRQLPSKAVLFTTNFDQGIDVFAFSFSIPNIPGVIPKE